MSPAPARGIPWATEAVYRTCARATPVKVWADLTERLRNPWLSPAESRAARWAKLSAMLEHCWERVPFYRALWAREGVDPRRFCSEDDLEHLPTITKDDLRQAQRSGALRVDDARAQPLTTSGTTTGEPFRVWIGFREYQRKYANHLRQLYIAGWRLGMRSAALHYSGHGQFRGRYSGRHDDREAWQGWRNLALALAHRRKVLSPYDRGSTGDDAIVARWYQDLKRHRPVLVDTFYVNVLLLLDYIRRHDVEPLSIPLLFVLHTLTAREQDRLAREFRAEVFNRYSPHECEGIAFACDRHRGMHAALDSYVVEILDRDGRPAPPGEIGRIVVTDLENRTMPLIRYRIGDLGHWLGEPCPCGRTFPLMGDLDGREADLLDWGQSSPATSVAVERFFQADDRIRCFQVIQGGSEVCVHVMPAEPGFPDAVWSAACTGHLQSLLGHAVTVTIRAVDSTDFEPNGKYRFVRSERH
jgi:phenylacetate-coenzyme A ligase PaaK-like adenylate-forming protein